MSKSKNYDVFRSMYLEKPAFKQNFLLKIKERHPGVHLALQEHPGAIDVFLLRNKERPAGPEVKRQAVNEQKVDAATKE